MKYRTIDHCAEKGQNQRNMHVSIWFYLNLCDKIYICSNPVNKENHLLIIAIISGSVPGTPKKGLHRTKP